MSERIINNFIIKYESEDKSVLYEIDIKQGHPLKYTHYGKTYAKRTEATIRINGFIKNTNYVTKHNKDNDNLKYAVVAALKPIMNKIKGKNTRKNIWNLIFKQIN